MKFQKYNHKILRFTVLVLMFLGISVSLARPNSPAPVAAAELTGQFECLPAFYQTIGIYGPVDFKILKFDEGEVFASYEKIGSTGNNLTNAIAYNVKDDFIYGSIVLGDGTHIARIDKNIKVTNTVTDIGTLKGTNIVAADINKDGVYTYIQGKDLLGRYDVASRTQLSDVSLKDSDGKSENVGDLQDIVIRTQSSGGPLEEWAYGISNNKSQLVRINTSTGLVERIKLYDAATKTKLIPTGSPYGAGWAALENRLYFSNNNTGGIYQIYNYGTDSPTYGEPIGGEDTTGNDGASCPNAPPPFDYYNRPFLRVSGGDVRSGANFGGGDGNPKCTVLSDAAKDAAIITNGYYSSDDSAPAKYWGSSSGQYGVFASGDIGNQDTNTDNELDNNFYGNNFFIREKNKDLMFSNTDSSQYGQFYSGGPGVPCIDVAELVKKAADATPGATFSDFAGSTSDNRSRKKFKPSQTVNNMINVKGGSKVAIINGDLTINEDIKYSSGYGRLKDMPNLVVIVLGDINISNKAGQLDGTYIAYPAADGSKGIIRTCSEAGAKLAYSTCSKKLTVNGRLLAKKIEWKRTWGTVGKEGSLALNIKTCNAASSNSSELMSNAQICAAEFINFSPEAFFNTSTSTVTGEVGNVPLSTVDLPPVY